MRWYLHALEEVLIRLLARYGLHGERLAPYTGVWVNGAKVAAIGVALHNWVTTHGIALNVNPDLGHFGLIVPCGIADKAVTSLANLLPRAPAMPEVNLPTRKCFDPFGGPMPGARSRCRHWEKFTNPCPAFTRPSPIQCPNLRSS